MTAPEVRELYRSAPEGFIAARDALVKRLRDEGHDADAADVKKLRRPTVPAWALDRLADEAPDAIAELLEAGADLASAQRATLSGRDPQALRQASARRRDAIARLSLTAAGVLRDAGRSPDPHLEDIRGTLEAASVDEEVAERLRNGTLDRTVQPPSGFGDVAGLQLVSRRDEPAPESARASDRSRSRRDDDDVDRERAHEAEVRRLRRDRDVAERKAAAAESARSRLAEQARSMGSRLDDVRAKLHDAESSASELRMQAKRATKALEVAERKRKGKGG